MKYNLLTRNFEGAGSWCGMFELPIRYDLPSTKSEPAFVPFSFCVELKQIHKTNNIILQQYYAHRTGLTVSIQRSWLSNGTWHTQFNEHPILLIFGPWINFLGEAGSEWGRTKSFWTFWNLLFMCFQMIYHVTLTNQHPFLVILKPGTDSWAGQVKLVFEFLKSLSHWLSNGIWYDHT